MLLQCSPTVRGHARMKTQLDCSKHLQNIFGQWAHRNRSRWCLFLPHLWATIAHTKQLIMYAQFCVSTKHPTYSEG